MTIPQPHFFNGFNLQNQNFRVDSFEEFQATKKKCPFKNCEREWYQTFHTREAMNGICPSCHTVLCLDHLNTSCEEHYNSTKCTQTFRNVLSNPDYSIESFAEFQKRKCCVFPDCTNEWRQTFTKESQIIGICQHCLAYLCPEHWETPCKEHYFPANVT